MFKEQTITEAYASCQAGGFLKELSEVNLTKAKTLLANAEETLVSAKTLEKALDSKSKGWLNVYTLHYDALHMLAEAVVGFSKISSSNHQCLFAALLTKHPELELDWNFFEKIRTKRNSSMYYGGKIQYTDWKEVKVQFSLYASALQKLLLKKIG